jgi:hypothetical protein
LQLSTKAFATQRDRSADESLANLHLRDKSKLHARTLVIATGVLLCHIVDAVVF